MSPMAPPAPKLSVALSLASDVLARISPDVPEKYRLAPERNQFANASAVPPALPAGIA